MLERAVGTAAGEVARSPSSPLLPWRRIETVRDLAVHASDTVSGRFSSAGAASAESSMASPTASTRCRVAPSREAFGLGEQDRLVPPAPPRRPSSRESWRCSRSSDRGLPGVLPARARRRRGAFCSRASRRSSASAAGGTRCMATAGDLCPAKAGLGLVKMRGKPRNEGEPQTCEIVQRRRHNTDPTDTVEGRGGHWGMTTRRAISETHWLHSRWQLRSLCGGLRRGQSFRDEDVALKPLLFVCDAIHPDPTGKPALSGVERSGGSLSCRIPGMLRPGRMRNRFCDGR